jgi:tetratricopeptide (TPR) repeat protein
LCWVLLSSFIACTVTRAQTLQQTKVYAIEQYEQQQYKAAIEALERVLYFNRAENPAENYWHLAQSYFGLNDIERAIYYYDLAYFAAEDVRLQEEALLRKAQCHLIQQEYSFALKELLNLDHTSPLNEHHNLDFHLAIAYYGVGKYPEAEEAFLKLIPDSLAKDRAEIQHLFAKVRADEKINPKKAQLLSILVPGLGQMYYKDYRNGINSMALNGALVLVFARVAMGLSFLDAALVVGPWFQRYYTGGYTRARSGAVAEISKRKAKAYHQILDVIDRHASTDSSQQAKVPMTLNKK